MPDVPDCLPICRWQVAAYADVLGIRPEAVEVGLATGEPTAPIQVAVVRVPHPDMPFVFAYWEQALEREWPEVHRDTVDVVPGQAFFAFRQRLTGPQEIAPAWYVRWLGDVLVIVSDEVAQSVGSQPRTRVSALLEALPTPR
jgi:hypothetical protein